MASSNPILPKLTLVGAGPGDPDLITVKAIKAIADADVILYDALVSKELLNYASSKAKKIFVGKRKGKHSLLQDEINRLAVEKAFENGHVVRLKGGDPFVFGRGHEELEYAEAFGIPTFVIPGISSSIAIPELQKIPLTKRGISESFMVVTGSTAEGAISKDLYFAAHSDSTVIILMGMHKLFEIVQIFKRAGKIDTHIAIIQNGSLPEENFAIGTIGSIIEIVEKNKVSSPAVIVIGEVVKLHPQLKEVLQTVMVDSNFPKRQE